MAQATGGNAKIIELEGTTGASPAIDRKKGFDEAITQCSGMQVVVPSTPTSPGPRASRSTETLLQSHPDATAIYAHNDEMALGAIAAIKAIGKVPGQDIKVVSIDGEKDGSRPSPPVSCTRRRVQPALRPARLPDHGGLRRRRQSRRRSSTRTSCSQGQRGAERRRAAY